MQVQVSRRLATCCIVAASGSQLLPAGPAEAATSRAMSSAGVPASTARVRDALMDAAARGRERCTTPSNVLTTSLSTMAQQVKRLSKMKQKGLVVEQLQYMSDPGSQQGWVPTTIVSKGSASPQPAVVFLHATGSSKEAMLPRMMDYAAAGYVGVAIDCRYHGARAAADAAGSARDGYQQALVRAWRQGPERPFLLDNVWDLLSLLDVLGARPDVDAARIGMTGVSLGGMHTWLCAALDERVAAAAPEIGVQYFRWAIENEAYQGRVSSIPLVFDAAAQDLGKPGVDAEVVEAVWSKIMPGLLDAYDAPFSLPTLAPRPLLIANGELDPRCPMQGVNEALKPAREAYASAGASSNLELYVEPGVGHQETAGMQQAVRAFFDKHLLASK